MGLNQEISLLLIGAGISLVTLTLQHLITLRQDKVKRERDAHQKLREQLQYPRDSSSAITNLDKLRTQLKSGRPVHVTQDGKLAAPQKTTVKPQRWFCFLKGTEISLHDQERVAIENTEPGMELLSYDPDSHCYLMDKVERLNEHETSQYVVINDGIRVTSPHLFYANGTWVSAKKLRLGDSLITLSGQPLAVESLELKTERQTVYSIDTIKHGPFFAEGILVNNQFLKGQSAG